MTTHNKANWEALVEQVETVLTGVLESVQKREELFAEHNSTSANATNAEPVFRKIESFHERLRELQAKAERAQQVVTQLDRQWAKGEKEIREHLERVDKLAPKLRAWVGK